MHEGLRGWLSTTCKRPDVVGAYLGCFGLNGAAFDASQIAVLRTAIRRELGIRKRLPEDPELSYISTVGTASEAAVS